MKAKLFNALLIVSSLFGYLEWGTNNREFLFQGETEIILKLFSDPASVLHPFILLPVFGQILLLITVFQKQPNKLITFAGIAGIGILLVLMFVIGCLSLNFRILLSTLPFLVLAFSTIRYHRKLKSR